MGSIEKMTVNFASRPGAGARGGPEIRRQAAVEMHCFTDPLHSAPVASYDVDRVPGCAGYRLEDREARTVGQRHGGRTSFHCQGDGAVSLATGATAVGVDASLVRVVYFHK